MSQFAFPRLNPTQGTEVLRLIGLLDEFKGHWRRIAEIRADKLAALRQVATIESAASSTRIEGARLSDIEVARVLQGLTVDSFLERDASEVRGYGELNELIYASFDAVPLSENTLKQFHGILLRHSDKDERHRGEYKKLANDVVAKHPDGRTDVLFETSTPFDTPRHMSELVQNTNAALDAGELHPLLIIAQFVVTLLAIHPFQDGNGRLSRSLTTLLLLRCGYAYVPYASLERVVEATKAEYYAALRTSQVAMRAAPDDYGDWLVFLLRALAAQKRTLEAKLAVEHGVMDLSAAQADVLEHITRHGRATTTEIGNALRMPYRTVRYHLDSLVGRGLIAAHGLKRGRHYTRSIASADPLRPSPVEGGTNDVIADIFLQGGRIKRQALIALLRKHGFDPRTSGILHGRRVAHLKRDSRTGESLLTARGEEVAKQVVLSRRLAGRAE